MRHYSGQDYEKILQAQKLYLASPAGNNRLIRTRHWYSQRRYADHPQSWKSLKEL